MVFGNEIANMTPGQALMDVPIPALIENTAKAIAKAQYSLDESAIQIAKIMSTTKVGLKNADGTVDKKSLLELGFSPTFYHFSETEMEFKVVITVKVEKGFDLKAGAGVSVGDGAPGVDMPAGGTGGGTGGGAAGAAGALASAAGGTGVGESVPVAFGASLNMDIHHKYGFDMEAATTIKTKMKALPPPQVFINTIQSHAAKGGTFEE